MIKRREFIAGLGGTVVWPVMAGAQQSAMPVIGYLSSLGQNDRPELANAFRRGLREGGYVEGHNVAIEYRFAENQYDRLPALVANLVGRNVTVIAATGGANSISATKAATTTVPIVFIFGGDPVHERFVASLNHPGGNITGVSFFNTELTGKGFGLLHELVPNAVFIALMVNPKSKESERVLSDGRKSALALGQKLLVFNASSPSEIDAVFATLRQQNVHAFVVASDPFFSSRRQQIVALVARDAIPAIYPIREFVAEGGLMSYGNDVSDAYRRGGLQTGRILKGEKPADLPIDQATKFEFLINQKTAKALGLTIPPTLLARADEVIE